MNKLNSIRSIRNKLQRGQPTIGGWMQIPHGSVAEILGATGFDWATVDMEHGSISLHQLPDLFRALELGGTLPLVRVAEGDAKECKQVLDAGAGGVIVPNVQKAEQLISIRNFCRWPPSGKRGVGFSRANLFGGSFKNYAKQAQEPLLVAMIEEIEALKNLDKILEVEGLDAILIGPYDLSASVGRPGDFQNKEYVKTCRSILAKAKRHKIAVGIHVINPLPQELRKRIKQGYQFLPYSMDSVILSRASKYENPK